DILDVLLTALGRYDHFLEWRGARSGSGLLCNRGRRRAADDYRAGRETKDGMDGVLDVPHGSSLHQELLFTRPWAGMAAALTLGIFHQCLYLGKTGRNSAATLIAAARRSRAQPPAGATKRNPRRNARLPVGIRQCRCAR